MSEPALQRDLFTAERVRLTEVNPDDDAPVEAVWTHDPAYAARFYSAPLRPLNAQQLKKRYERTQFSEETAPERLAFAVRRREDNCLVGFLRIPAIYWPHQAGLLAFGFGEPEDEDRYGAELLALAVDFLFNELNLRRISTSLPASDARRIRLLEAAGFVLETTRRQAAYASGQLTDELIYALLAQEWAATAARRTDDEQPRG